MGHPRAASRRRDPSVPWAAAGTLALMVALCIMIVSPAQAAAAKQEAMNDGLFLVYINEAELKTESGAAADYTQPDPFISMPKVMLAGQPVDGSPVGEVEEGQCVAACRAATAAGCNTYFYCPLEQGCSVSLTNASEPLLPYRHCALRSHPNALAAQAHPPEAIEKGDMISVTSGQVVLDMSPQPLPGYTLHMCLGWYNMYDYTCNGTLKPNVCMKQGPLQAALDECNAEGVKCMGIKWFPEGRDYLGKEIYMLKGIPDTPTEQNLPAVPVELSLANWNGDVLFYAKDMNDTQLAEARSYLPTAPAAIAAPPSGGGGLGAGAEAGIVVGSVAAVAALCVALLLVRRRKRQRQLKDAETGGGGGGGDGDDKVVGEGGDKDSRSSVDYTSAGSGVPFVQLNAGRLTLSDVASMASPLTSTGTAACTSGGTSGTGGGTSGGTAGTGGARSFSGRSSMEPMAVAGELGKEWVLDVSQLVFVMGRDGLPLELGSGAQGVVYKALLNGTEPVAAKVMTIGSNPDAQAQFMSEALMLRQLRHRNMVHFVGVALHDDKAVVLTEFMEGRDLFHARSTKSPGGGRFFSWYGWGRRVALDVASGLAYLHHKRVMHFDIKSSNVLLSRDMTAKLCDVGLSRAMTKTHASLTNGSVGTFAFCAPEVLMGKRCSYPADIYSFGVLLWEICTGEAPLRGRLDSPKVPEECPQGVADLMMRCFSEDPALRPTAPQLIEELSALAGVQLGGPNGVMPGAEGLERPATSASQVASPQQTSEELQEVAPRQEEQQQQVQGQQQPAVGAGVSPTAGGATWQVAAPPPAGPPAAWWDAPAQSPPAAAAYAGSGGGDGVQQMAAGASVSAGQRLPTAKSPFA